MDIDLALQSDVLTNTKEGGANQIVREALQEAASAPLGDWFAYGIGEAAMDLEAAPYGGARYPVEARMDARIFARFHLGVGIGDPVMKPLETVEGRDWLQFAGIAAPPFWTIPQVQQFAEKLHAYALPRSTPNSRVKDLIDLLLLIRSGKVASVAAPAANLSGLRDGGRAALLTSSFHPRSPPHVCKKPCGPEWS